MRNLTQDFYLGLEKMKHQSNNENIECVEKNKHSERKLLTRGLLSEMGYRGGYVTFSKLIDTPSYGKFVLQVYTEGNYVAYFGNMFGLEYCGSPKINNDIKWSDIGLEECSGGHTLCQYVDELEDIEKRFMKINDNCK